MAPAWGDSAGGRSLRMLSISLAPEVVMDLFGLRVTNTFLTTVLVTLLLGATAVLFSPRPDRKPRGFLGKALQVFTYEVLKTTDRVTGDRALSKRVLPVIATFFLFIGAANMLALLPGFLGSFYVGLPGGPVPLLRSPDSDLTTTLALTAVGVGFTQYVVARILGVGGYLRRFFDVASPVAFVTGFFELLSEAVKVLSFSFRLFGNVFAGEVVLLVAAFFLPYLLPLPFMILELFIGLLQAYIFGMLILTFIKADTLRPGRAAAAG